MAEFLASQLADPQMCRNRCASTDGRVPGLATRRPADVQKAMRLHRWQSSWPRNSPTRRCAEIDAPPMSACGNLEAPKRSMSVVCDYGLLLDRFHGDDR